MAASTVDTIVDEGVQFFDDIDDFHNSIDETDAVNDLEDLLLSDDECFIDIDLDADQECRSSVSDPVTHDVNDSNVDLDERTHATCSEKSDGQNISNNIELDPNMKCPKCQKIYKRQWHLERHIGSCTGKRRKVNSTPKTTTSNSTQAKGAKRTKRKPDGGDAQDSRGECEFALHVDQV